MQSETILIDVAGLRLSERVLRIGPGLGRGAQKPHRSFSGGLARSLLEKVRRGFHHSNFFGDRYRDPLVQRHAIFFRQPLGSLLDGERKLQWISRFAHYLSLTFFNSSAGRNTRILNRGCPTLRAFLSSHFSCTAITDTQSQSRNNSPTVQYRKLCPSPETDPTSAAKPSSALFEKLTQSRRKAVRRGDPAPRRSEVRLQR